MTPAAHAYGGDMSMRSIRPRKPLRTGRERSRVTGADICQAPLASGRAWPRLARVIATSVPPARHRCSAGPRLRSTRVVPIPHMGSTTMSPGFEYARRIRRASSAASCRGAGWTRAHNVPLVPSGGRLSAGPDRERHRLGSVVANGCCGMGPPTASATTDTTNRDFGKKQTLPPPMPLRHGTSINVHVSQSPLRLRS